MTEIPPPTLQDIEAAAARLVNVTRRTPLLESVALSQACGGDVWVKAEVLQRTGSFKLRGATNMIANLTERGSTAGVIAASAGNHAQGVAVAALALGRPCTIVMPESAIIAKIEATRSYGAEVILYGRDFGEAYAEATRIGMERGLVFIPAYDDPLIVAGQGTLGLEIIEDMPDLDLIVVPVGGGGLAAGVAIAAKGRRPDVQIVGVQAEACPGAIASLATGAPTPVKPTFTIADGIAVPAPGAVTFPILRGMLSGIVTVSEEAISRAMALLLERSKLVVEGAGSVGAAALLSGAIDIRGKKVCVVLSGGNVDINVISRIVQHGLSAAGRYLTIKVLLDDRPGHLAHILTAVGRSGANILDIEHGYPGVEAPFGKAEVELVLELRNPPHGDEVVAAIEEAGYAQRYSESARVKTFVPR